MGRPDFTIRGAKREQPNLDREDERAFFGAAADLRPNEDNVDLDDDADDDSLDDADDDADTDPVNNSADGGVDLDDVPDDIDNLSHQLSSTKITADRITLNKKRSSLVLPIHNPQMGKHAGRKVAVVSVLLPEQYSESYHHHISDGGKRVIIEFPKAASIFNTSFLSTVTEGGVLKEMYDGYVLEQREVAAQTEQKTYGSDRIVFDLPFQSEEIFYPGLYPRDEFDGEGIGCAYMTSEDTQGIVMTFAIIEKMTIAQKLKSPGGRKVKKKNVASMQGDQVRKERIQREAVEAARLAAHREDARNAAAREQQVHAARQNEQRQNEQRQNHEAARIAAAEARAFAAQQRQQQRNSNQVVEEEVDDISM